jgi:hypothetical protein
VGKAVPIYWGDWVSAPRGGNGSISILSSEKREVPEKEPIGFKPPEQTTEEAPKAPLPWVPPGEQDG